MDLNSSATIGEEVNPYFVLYPVQILLVDLPEISAFGKILPEEFVGIFDGAFLSGTERVCEIHRGSDAA